ncbi:LLM class flavin-dependent oxidoreductase [Nakamurella antarctica]|uniref:LLM class flavin-dependent oxidoreductase n=1 Tax=Nakamurella antarctica TaxID=1902245 RepID=A0A3G8ZLV2_9ACTN|nr:LLM class flavin-dependent oxidoreductase [Nakamurella antarctica]AZI58319.1 LLM class flavin-dependent oxidoreductase [Nakamurella antarctica]
MSAQTHTLPLSVLELSPVLKNAGSAQALHYSTELARCAEALGYQRFWVAEHHNMPAIASSSPAVLIAHLAAATSTIRVGSGGVMLPNHAPLVVAEQFGMLASLHPGRIDLGIGRAPGTDGRTAMALRRTSDGLSAEDFPAELADVMAMLAGSPDLLTAVPRAETMPQVWLLGSSGFSAQLAGMLGLPFSFAHHFSSDNTEAALALYRSTFTPSRFLAEPYAMIGVNAVCAPTDEEAEYLAKPGILAFLRLRTGRPQALETPEDAAKYQFTDAEMAFAAQRRRGQLLGSPETVRAQLALLVDRTHVDELMLTSQVYDVDARIRTLEFVADLVSEGIPALV